ncbi:glycosyltransferase family 4 protein [Nodularia spumigena CS-591/12]|uniref:glycosyltransferase family 4 protein n=1 Tax=Nodularia spumigena TaxID=70799 RepID=UPI00232AA82F|nr:glycosyltransferase family 4 protein [Nodularia spumigena]MDB9303323.1 glycosyltransferase family 4 protein [Nodularia spumigena CS-591/12]MDB9347608.1 glycosyltransferase family 4 protein [Nodularia spumigena CS-588/01]MDB9353812.1 glycosyltransferase family 4 protein [Nodularia spumigena CS-588/05]
MKVSLLSRSDGRGGGYAAAYRLHQGLKKINIDSTMLVSEKNRDDFTVLGSNNKLGKGWGKIAPTLHSLPLIAYPKRQNKLIFSLQWMPDKLAAQVAKMNPDVINLHWINGGYLRIETLAKFKKPIVWTLHDMWAFTGGCHYSANCDKYTKFCGACPQLGSHKERDISRWIWQRKAKAWKNINLTIVTPSRWLAECARKSSLFHNSPIEVIPNALDTQIYKPIDKTIARKLLNLPLDKKLLLFGAMNSTSDRRKGFHLLEPALRKLSQDNSQENIELVIFGASRPLEVPHFGWPTNYLGRLNDDISLSLVYSAADVFLAPSVEDNLPNTVMEALACGTACIAFDIGGMSDMIEHQQNGYLAKPFDIDDFAKGIAWVIIDDHRHARLSNRSRDRALKLWSDDVVAKQYLAVYEQAI